MNITTIIPVHEYNDQISSLLDKAIESVQKQEGISELPQIIVVCAFSIADDILKYQQTLLTKYPNGINIIFISDRKSVV